MDIGALFVLLFEHVGDNAKNTRADDEKHEAIEKPLAVNSLLIALGLRVRGLYGFEIPFGYPNEVKEEAEQNHGEHHVAYHNDNVHYIFFILEERECRLQPRLPQVEGFCNAKER